MERIVMLRVFVIVAISLLSGASLFAAPPARKIEPRTIEFTDLKGHKQSPLEIKDCKATVLFFVLPDCPISNAYAPEINRIISEYVKQGIAAFVVYVDPDMSIDEAKKHTADFGYTCPVLLDTSLQLVKYTGVTIAPEVAVLGPDGQRLYRGRIDNLYAGLGKRRAKVTERDLRDTLDAVLAGMPVPKETTTAIGCYIAKPAAKTDSE